MSSRQFRPGDMVEVRSEVEIMQSLDAEGKLDELPFMPEMLELCGKRFHVLGRIEKTCCDAPTMQMREFVPNDVVFLDEIRCSGANHGGCQIGCMVFWKESWLRLVDEKELSGRVEPEGAASLRSLLNARVGERFVCQSTELVHATVPLSRPRLFLACFREVKAGTYRTVEMMGWIIRPVIRKLLRAVRGEFPRGSQTQTPTQSLKLEPGEWVEVKSVSEIAQTLDKEGKNRGLHFSEDMRVFCGRRFRVRNRLERMILAHTGRMHEIRDTVVLDEVTCGYPFTIGGCTRREFQYWREIWLRRVAAPGLQTNEQP